MALRDNSVCAQMEKGKTDLRRQRAGLEQIHFPVTFKQAWSVILFRLANRTICMTTLQSVRCSVELESKSAVCTNQRGSSYTCTVCVHTSSCKGTGHYWYLLKIIVSKTTYLIASNKPEQPFLDGGHCKSALFGLGRKIQTINLNLWRAVG